MSSNMEEYETEVDETGRLILPPKLAHQFGLSPGTKVRIAKNGRRIHLRQPVTHLSKVYIEPTSRCNLACVTCIRHSWDETLGEMNSETFSNIIEGIRSFSPAPEIFFGGLGEPLSHPDIVEMMRKAKTLGSSVGMITNGTLLTESLSAALIDAGLDVLWVSLDGASPESYADVRLGAAFSQVIENIAALRRVRWRKRHYGYTDTHSKPKIGIEFVAMKRNIKDLSAVIGLASRLGARHFMVTNVLPYTKEMRDEILYGKSLGDSVFAFTPISLDVPRMDLDALSDDVIHPSIISGLPLNLEAEASTAEKEDRCPFVENGSMAIRWDGQVSPCLALLHDHRSYLDRFQRSIRHYSVGDASGRSIAEIWSESEYVSFRERVQRFDFSPCASCGGWDYIEANEGDCVGSPFPACGACLWAQGIIQCP
jgi:MoaA/NifB/PqqE/SkfB family radical SAM enzyme